MRGLATARPASASLCLWPELACAPLSNPAGRGRRRTVAAASRRPSARAARTARRSRAPAPPRRRPQAAPGSRGWPPPPTTPRGPKRPQGRSQRGASPLRASAAPWVAAAAHEAVVERRARFLGLTLAAAKRVRQCARMSITRAEAREATGALRGSCGRRAGLSRVAPRLHRGRARAAARLTRRARRRADEGFAVSAALAENMASFVVRMAFLLGEQVKDKDHTVRAPRAARAPGGAPAPVARRGAGPARVGILEQRCAAMGGCAPAGPPALCQTWNERDKHRGRPTAGAGGRGWRERRWACWRARSRCGRPRRSSCTTSRSSSSRTRRRTWTRRPRSSSARPAAPACLGLGVLLRP